MYRRPTLCTLHIAVDFLKSLEIAVVWGGGGGATGIYYIFFSRGFAPGENVRGLTTGLKFLTLYPLTPPPPNVYVHV